MLDKLKQREEQMVEMWGKREDKSDSVPEHGSRRNWTRKSAGVVANDSAPERVRSHEPEPGRSRPEPEDGDGIKQMRTAGEYMLAKVENAERERKRGARDQRHQTPVTLSGKDTIGPLFSMGGFSKLWEKLSRLWGSETGSGEWLNTMWSTT